MYCGRCGAEIKDKTARFCDNCGAPLETGGGQNDYGSEDTYNGRGNRRNGTYSGTVPIMMAEMGHTELMISRIITEETEPITAHIITEETELIMGLTTGAPVRTSRMTI